MTTLPNPSTRIRRLAVPGLALILLSACTTAPSPTAAPPSVNPSPSSQPSAGVDFTLSVLPELFVGKAIGGQRVLLLVTVSGAPADGPVDVSASAAGAVAMVAPARLSPGTVGEVTVIPAPVTAEQELVVTITATRGGVERTAERTVGMFPGEDSDAGTAAEHLARFIPWLAANHPELGITAETEWTTAEPPPLLVGSHYLFYSDEWELHVMWHVMIPPYDWTKYELRRRFAETEYSQGFVISSRSADPPVDPEPLTPENTLWR